jgi:polysaccharide biosynthesis transport protein
VATGLDCFGSAPMLGAAAARPSHQPSNLINVLRLTRAALTERPSAGPRYVGFTSFGAGEGKSTLSLAFAHLMAGEGQRVLLIDASVPHLELTRWLAPSAETGLGQALRMPDGFRDACISHLRPNLDFLPGKGPGSDLDERWRRLPRDWRPADGGAYDWCVFDMPSLTPSVDIRVVGGAMDRLVLVTAWGRTPAGELTESLAALGPVRDRIAGAIINMTPQSVLRAGDRSAPAGRPVLRGAKA